jgi:hypothetical protein
MGRQNGGAVLNDRRRDERRLHEWKEQGDMGRNSHSRRLVVAQAEAADEGLRLRNECNKARLSQAQGTKPLVCRQNRRSETRDIGPKLNLGREYPLRSS